MIGPQQAVRPLAGRALDRSSFVPLYYQLQEVIKEQIESGIWSPGEALPSEPRLATQFGVSRVVVRQALAILEDDRQILRIKGRGTFVAEPKLDARAGGLSVLLRTPRGRDVQIQCLDTRPARVEKSIREALELPDDVEVLRLTTMLSVRGTPMSITYSFFRRDEVGWLESVVRPGRALPPSLTLAGQGIELAASKIAIETSQCGQFEADRFGIPHRAPVFLVLCTECRRHEAGVRPFEVARVEYRGDLIRIRLQTSSADPGGLEALWEMHEDERLDPALRRSEP